MILCDNYGIFDKLQRENIKNIEFVGKDISKYSGNEEVDIIIACRATAKKVADLNFPNLKFIQLESAGYDGVPLDKFSEKEISVCNASNVYNIPIAETVIFAILQYEKRFWKTPKLRLPRPFRKYKYIGELYGKKAIILGCGNIGVSVATRLQAFGVDVYGYDPYCENNNLFSQIFRSNDELYKHLGEFDYIVSTLPDTETTRGFLNKDFFSYTKRSAFLVNVGRRTVINDKDFYSELKKKNISAALDMFEIIPNPITNKYRRFSNVIILPGVAAVSKDNNRLVQLIKENISRFSNGETLKYKIN